ncbi:MAG TPA: hypothetical protein VLG27_04605 [Candidatus Saccharimonadia bacterium]|nr:hypothetical protein [Candidatus Saccharimonadia bacterium]
MAQRPRNLRLIAFLVGLLIIAGVAAILADHKSKPAASTTKIAQLHPTNDKTIESDCLKSYSNDHVLCKFAVSASDITKLSYQATDTLTDAHGQSKTETIMNDGTTGNISVETSDQGKVSDVVQVGNTVYLKQSGANTWYKFTSNQPSNNNPANGLKPNFSSSSTPESQKIHYKSLGTEACGQLTCYKYEITRKGAPGKVTTVWFDTQDYRIQHWRSQSPNGTDDFVITYAPVSIATPSPAVNAPGTD